MSNIISYPSKLSSLPLVDRAVYEKIFSYIEKADQDSPVCKVFKEKVLTSLKQFPPTTTQGAIFEVHVIEHIQDPELIFDVLKICIVSAPEETLPNWDQFNLRKLPLEKRFELAELWAQKIYIAEYIGAFGLTEEQNLEIFGICVQKSDRKAIEDIEQFHFTSQCNLKAAKIYATGATRFHCQSVKEAIRNLSYFNLTNQAPDFQLFEMALHFISLNKETEVAKNIKEFKLTLKQSFEVAQLCARKDSYWVAANIRDFCLTNEAPHYYGFEMAKLCADNAAGNIKNFDLTNDAPEYRLFEILKLCISHNPNISLDHLKEFKLTPSQSFEIAQVRVLKAPLNITWLKEHANEEERRALFLLAAQKEPHLFKKFSQMNFSPAATEGLENLFLMFLEERTDLGKAKDSLIQFIGTKFPDQTDYFKNQVAKISALSFSKLPQAREEYLKMRLLFWLGASLFILNEASLSKEEIEWIVTTDQLGNLRELEDFPLRYSLTFLLAKIVKEESLRTAYTDYGQKADGEQEAKLYLEKKYAYTKLFRLAAAGLQSVGVVDTASFTKQVDQMRLKGKHLFWGAKQFRALVRPLCFLVEEENLNSVEKNHVLTRLLEDSKKDRKINSKRLIENLSALQTIIDFKQIERLKNSSITFSELAEELFRQQIPIVGVSNFSTRYQETFAASRYPKAIHVYAALLNTLNNPKVTACLVQFVTLVLAGNDAQGKDLFKKKRYDTTSNPHLAKLSINFSKQLELWKEGSSFTLKELVSKKLDETKGAYKVIDTDDPFKLFFCGKGMKSCLSFDYNPVDSQALLGCVMNGQNRLLAIFDENGNMCARCIVRLLSDGSQPVIFLEDLYALEKNPEYQEAIIALAKKKAMKLGVDLTTHMQEGTALYGASLQSMGGLAPSDKSDAAESIKSYGNKFTIQDVKLLT